MVYRLRIVVPSSFRPDHQTGRVLARVAAELGRRGEVVDRQGERLVLEGVSPSGWNARFSGRGVVTFECQPPPGAFTIRISVVREALYTAPPFAVVALLTWLETGSIRHALIVASLALGVCAFWVAWGLYKVLLLRRLVLRGVTRIAA
jgi:hypothetical protein